jgi:hypothetical protein
MRRGAQQRMKMKPATFEAIFKGVSDLVIPRNSAEFVGQLCKLRADFIGALRAGLLSTRRPVEKPACRMQSCPTVAHAVFKSIRK